jgi:hypothetical protein
LKEHALNHLGTIKTSIVQTEAKLANDKCAAEKVEKKRIFARLLKYRLQGQIDAIEQVSACLDGKKNHPLHPFPHPDFRFPISDFFSFPFVLSIESPDN